MSCHYLVKYTTIGNSHEASKPENQDTVIISSITYIIIIINNNIISRSVLMCLKTRGNMASKKTFDIPRGTSHCDKIFTFNPPGSLKNPFSVGKTGSNGWNGGRDNSFGMSSSSASSSTSSASTPTGEEEDSCLVCARPRTALFCFSCGFFVASGRIKRPCTMHPKVNFYTDFATCPKCKKEGCLQEID
ncbi:unnamed protein product [Orchesella dallaii]|uniref:Uncharacterized protein n=1 Tax=Orchesella dallaii TaxID=48710 RepID=A0ABP1Q3N7_9HEXA